MTFEDISVTDGAVLVSKAIASTDWLIFLQNNGWYTARGYHRPVAIHL